MPTLRRRRRTTCSDCGSRCFVEPIEFMLHHKGAVGGYWLWCLATLCPPCRVARYDWWRALANGELAKKS